MELNDRLYEDLLGRAADSPRLRMHYDLRTSPEDGSQRMLNAVLPGSVIPVHRHVSTVETVVVLRGRVTEILYDDAGREVSRHEMGVGEGIQVPMAQYHTAVASEPSVIIEFKDGKYDPVTTEEFL